MHAVRVELSHRLVPLLVQVLPPNGDPDHTARSWFAHLVISILVRPMLRHCISIPPHERIGAWRTAPMLCSCLDTAVTSLIGSQLTWGWVLHCWGCVQACTDMYGHVWTCVRGVIV